MTRFTKRIAGVLNINGNTSRRWFDRASCLSPLHMISVWGHENA